MNPAVNDLTIPSCSMACRNRRHISCYKRQSKEYAEQRVGYNNENGPRSRKIKYVSLSYILFGLSQISSKAFCQKKLFASPLSTPSAVVTVRLVMCQMCTILSCTNSKKILLVKTSLVWQLSHYICMVDDDGL